jgi:hypothetical protein
MTSTKPTNRRHILWLVLSPTIWAAHFLASYLTIAIWCAKSTSNDAMRARLSVGVYTVIALLLVAAAGIRSWRQHRHDNAGLPHDKNSPEDQQGFIGYAGLLLAVLSAVATVFTALVVVFVGSCD